MQPDQEEEEEMPKETSLCPLPSSHPAVLPSCPAPCLLCWTISHPGPVPELDYLAFSASQSSPAPSPLLGEPAGKHSSASHGSAQGSGPGRQSSAKLSPAEPSLGKGNAGLKLLAWTWSRNPLPAVKVHEAQDSQGSELPLLLQPEWDCWLLTSCTAGNFDSLSAVESVSDV